MIPVVDNLDPDQQGPAKEEKEHEPTESIESIEQRHKDKETADAFLRKHGLYKEPEIKENEKKKENDK